MAFHLALVFQEEVIVGRCEGATIPEWHVSGKAVWPEKWWDMYKTKGGQSFDPVMIAAANHDLDGLANILEAEGVTVRRPEVMNGDYAQGYSTPDFTCKSKRSLIWYCYEHELFPFPPPRSLLIVVYCQVDCMQPCLAMSF